MLAVEILADDLGRRLADDKMWIVRRLLRRYLFFGFRLGGQWSEHDKNTEDHRDETTHWAFLHKECPIFILGYAPSAVRASETQSAAARLDTHRETCPVGEAVVLLERHISSLF